MTEHRLNGLLLCATLFLGASFATAQEADPNEVVIPITDPNDAVIPIDWTSAADLSTANLNQNAAAGPKCDSKKLAALTKAVKTSHKGLFYKNKFDYLCDPCYCDWWPGDALKRNCYGGWLRWDIGGQFRMRHHVETNHRGLGLTGRDDNFLLYRTRLYANVEMGDMFRVYAEMIDAESNYENFGPRPIEVNRADMLNLFGDVKLWDNGRGKLWARVGRQELLYGQQRVVSPLDWANTRRTFEGAKVFWEGENWNYDAFWTRPVAPVANRFDSPLQAQEFMGTFTTYKGIEDETLDFYYLRFNNATAGIKFDTAGAGWYGKYGDWQWDFEGAHQWGDFGAVSHRAGFATCGIGKTFANLPWKPTLWGYFDWASGDPTRGNGYHHLFPLAHKYNGFMDLYGRRNLNDINVLFTMQPHERVKFLTWWHTFNLENGADVPYSVVMTPFVATPGGSKHLGEELDLLMSVSINPRWNMLFGYSHFWSGAFYDTNPAVPFAGDANFIYTQSAFNF